MSEDVKVVLGIAGMVAAVPFTMVIQDMLCKRAVKKTKKMKKDAKSNPNVIYVEAVVVD